MSNTIDPSIAPGFTTAFPNVNTITLANIPLPGKWTLVRAPKRYGWQVQQQFGMSGAVVFPKGDPLVEAEFLGEFWSSIDYAIFKQVRAKLLANAAIKMPGGLFTAGIGVSHPELKDLGVDTVVILEINPGVQILAGRWSTKLILLQYRKPADAVKKPKLSIPDVTPPQATALTAAEIEGQALSATATTLSAQLVK